MSRRFVAVLFGVPLLLGIAACADESARPVLGPAPVSDVTVTVADSSEPVRVSPPATVPAAGDPTEDLEPLEGFEEGVLRVVNRGRETRWPVLYAGTLESRRQGLMGVTDLEGYAGMVFVFDADTEAAFWMRNTPMPLTVVFARADGSVVSTADMEPCLGDDDCPTYPPEAPYRFALEVPQGTLDDLGVVSTSLLGVE
jgi:uncharacterized membrane protein (UPF0127 family)